MCQAFWWIEKKKQEKNANTFIWFNAKSAFDHRPAMNRLICSCQGKNLSKLLMIINYEFKVIKKIENEFNGLYDDAVFVVPQT